MSKKKTGWVIRLAQEKFGPGYVSTVTGPEVWRNLYKTAALVFQDPQEASETMTSRGFQPQDFEVVEN